jgi:hypothetical protein
MTEPIELLDVVAIVHDLPKTGLVRAQVGRLGWSWLLAFAASRLRKCSGGFPRFQGALLDPSLWNVTALR